MYFITSWESTSNQQSRGQIMYTGIKYAVVHQKSNRRIARSVRLFCISTMLNGMILIRDKPLPGHHQIMFRNSSMDLRTPTMGGRL